MFLSVHQYVIPNIQTEIPKWDASVGDTAKKDIRAHLWGRLLSTSLSSLHYPVPDLRQEPAPVCSSALSSLPDRQLPPGLVAFVQTQHVSSLAEITMMVVLFLCSEASK